MDLPSLREIASVSLPLAVADWMVAIRGSSDILIVGAVLGPAMVGFYGPVKVCVKLVVFLLEPASRVMAPIIAGLQRTGATAELESLCRRAATYGAMLAVPATAVLFIWGDRILVAAFGPRYAEAGLLLAVLSVGPCLRALLGLPGVVLQMSGQHLMVMRVNVLAALLAVAGMAAAAPFGLLGLAAVSSGMVAVQAGVLALLAHRHLGIRTYAGVPLGR